MHLTAHHHRFIISMKETLTQF